MRRPLALPTLAILGLLLVQTNARSIDQTLIPAGASWRFNDAGTNLGTAWRAPAYADQSWASGLAQLGYGDGDEATVLSYGGNSAAKHITYYFRHSFTVSSPASFAAMTARLVRDDGAVVYLNGVEVARSNMPAGTVTFTTPASSAVSGSAESQWFDIPVDPSLLVAGVNVVAVEVHQSSASSSDLSFNFELIATAAQVPPPTVTLISPADQGVSNQAGVTFTADVAAPAGLADATLFISGMPLVATFTGPGQIEDAQMTADSPTVATAAAQRSTWMV
jgi:hypothetical protein